jgi:iron complex transport system ATP-binding protein
MKKMQSNRNPDYGNEIEIHDLTYQIKGKTILNDVNLKIKKSDFWLIFGPNGAGKTTLFKILTGLIVNYKGEIHVDTENIKKKSRKEMAKKISYLPQFDEFSLPLSVKEILLAGRYPYTSFFRDYSTNDYAILNEAVEQFGLGDFLNRDINTLSGGERKKVLLASAFIQDVSIILLDEPFTFLDPQAASNLKKNLVTLNKGGKTIIIISHHIETLFPLVNKTAAMKDGALVYSGQRKFDPAILKQIYGIRFNRTSANNREIIYIDE